MSSVTPNTELETYKVEPLQGSANYRTWKFSMRMVLQARDLWEVVSGEEVKPEAEMGFSYDPIARLKCHFTANPPENSTKLHSCTPKFLWWKIVIGRSDDGKIWISLQPQLGSAA